VAAFEGLKKFKMVAVAMKMTAIANRNGRNMVQHVLLPVNIHFH
jgi:hypothetical protein